MSVSIETGSEAPDFTLPAHTGESVHLADFRGQQNVVMFFMREFT